jgi:hypothetical protein
VCSVPGASEWLSYSRSFSHKQSIGFIDMLELVRAIRKQVDGSQDSFHQGAVDWIPDFVELGAKDAWEQPALDNILQNGIFRALDIQL